MDRELYQDIVLEHFRNPMCKTTLDSADSSVFTIRNPNCGDIVSLKAEMNAENQVTFVHDAQGCAASVASASIFCSTISGMELNEAKTGLAAFLGRLDGTAPDAPLCGPLSDNIEIDALLFFKNVPARQLCVSLAWKCAEKALAEQ